MAFKHRKLFPIQTVTNQTIDCPLFCDPSCPYECYPYSGFYFPPPIPSPPPIDPSDKKISLSPSMIIIVTLLASFFLIVSYYAIIVKCCSNCNRSRNRSQHPQSDGAEEDDQERLDENLGPVIDNPIWFITTVGLQQAIINSITVCKYKKGEGLIEGTECSVCLSEFKEEETLRLLPKCNHAFHIHCIDTWLRSHTNCPLCRARIVTDTVTAISDHNSQNFSGNEDTQIGNYEGEFELGENQARNNGFSAENRAGTEDGSELQQGNFEDRTSKKAVHSDGNIDNCPQILGKTVDNHKDIEVGARPPGRSISMGSTSTGSIRLSLSTFDSADSEGNSLERSFSCSGISFLPRHDGRCSDSVLPL